MMDWLHSFWTTTEKTPLPAAPCNTTTRIAPSELQLEQSKKRLHAPVARAAHVVQPEFILCRQMLRKTTTRKPETVLEIQSPLFLEMMQKYHQRQARLEGSIQR